MSVCSLLESLYCSAPSVWCRLRLLSVLFTFFLPCWSRKLGPHSQSHLPGAVVLSCPFISLIVALGQHLICPSLPAQVGHRECYTCRGLRASPGEHGPKMGLTCLHPARAVGTSPAGWASFPAALYGNMTTERTHALWSAATLWPALV